MGRYDEEDQRDDDFDAWLLREHEQFTAAVRESVDTDAVLHEVKRRSAETARLEIENRVAVAAATGRPPSPEPDWPVDRWERVDADYMTASPAIAKLTGVSKAPPPTDTPHSGFTVHCAVGDLASVVPPLTGRGSDVASELLAALTQGQKWALQRIVSLITPLTYRYFRAEASITGRPLSVADGQARTALFAVLRELPRYDHHEQTFLRFAYGILRREAQSTDTHELSCRHVVQQFSTIEERGQGFPLGSGTGRRRHEARLLTLLGTLDGSKREVVVLRVLVGLNVDEVASATGLSPSVVLVRQSRALHDLRRKLTQSE